MRKTKIIIAGIGGVGGYFGGLLAKHFENSETVEVYFIARGEHLKAIQDNGLSILKGESEVIAHPVLATENPAEIGLADFILICTKSYDLENIIEQLKPCIGKESIILPLLNGINNREIIERLLPDHVVLDGCVYIVSRLKKAGVIENSGNIQSLYFGKDNISSARLQLLEDLFKAAKIDAAWARNISTIIWEKFIFLSPTATATTYFDKSIGELLADQQYFQVVTGLIEEVKQLALEKDIAIADDITEKTLAKLKAFPFETTSSMHADFKNHKTSTELEILTAFVITEGEKYKIETPVYRMAYDKLRIL